MGNCQESRFYSALHLNTFFFLVSRDLLIYVADNTHLKECFAKDGSLDFLDLCTEATNGHAAEDASFIEEIGIIEKSEKRRAFMKGFLAIKWYLSLLGYSQKQWVWSEDPFKNQTEIKKVMTYLQFQLMAKHIRVTKPSEIPWKGSPSYHPLQNILSGVDHLRRKSASLWIPGKRMCLDEGRVGCQ